MTRQWMRYVSVTLSGGSLGTMDLSDLRCRFKIYQDVIEQPNSADVTISNVLPSYARSIIAAKGQKITLTIKAGYQQGANAVIFTGDLLQARYGKESPTDTAFILHAADGATARRLSVINKQLKGGSTGQDMYDALQKAMEQYGVQKGFASSVLLKKTFPRSMTMFGNAKDYLRTLSSSIGGTWGILNGKLNVVGIGEKIPGTAVILTPDTGLIGMPEQDENGIHFRTLINPDILVFGVVQCDSSLISESAYNYGPQGNYSASLFGIPTGPNLQIPNLNANGLYKVLRASWYGDTYGNPWYMDLDCLDITAASAPTTSDLSAWFPKDFYSPYITQGS